MVSEALLSAIDIAPTVLELAGLPVPENVQGRSLSKLLQDPNDKICDYVFAERNWHVCQANERMVRWKEYVYIRNLYPNIRSFINLSRTKPALKELVQLHREDALNKAQSFIFNAPYPEEQLYHLTNDPHQLNNLADDATHREALEHLRAKIDEWRDKTGDSTPPPEKATPDRMNLETGENLFEGWRPPSGVIPGEEVNAQQINVSGPR